MALNSILQCLSRLQFLEENTSLRIPHTMRGLRFISRKDWTCRFLSSLCSTESVPSLYLKRLVGSFLFQDTSNSREHHWIRLTHYNTPNQKIQILMAALADLAGFIFPKQILINYAYTRLKVWIKEAQRNEICALIPAVLIGVAAFFVCRHSLLDIPMVWWIADAKIEINVQCVIHFLF